MADDGSSRQPARQTGVSTLCEWQSPRKMHINGELGHVLGRPCVGQFAIEVDGHSSVLVIVLVPSSFERLWSSLVRKCVDLLGKGVFHCCYHVFNLLDLLWPTTSATKWVPI